MKKRLQVWADARRVGLLETDGDRPHYVFGYDPDAESPIDQVSLTMPVRLESWSSWDLHPVFQMNLPEGALLEAIRRSIAKITDSDDLTILRITGGNQVGRNRFSFPGDSCPGMMETAESLSELLSYPDTAELFHDLVSRYALRSGISGVQPKVMLEASERGTAAVGSFIVKSWGSDYPQLAANEFFCMTAVKRAGLPVPEFHLSENGGLFVMKRFDMDGNGMSLGFEDMCSLQGLGTSRKYNSTYERVAGSIRDFVAGEFLQQAREQFFASVVFSCLLGNGDAHLKNFGIIYRAPGEPVHLSPVYDMVTTTAYIPKDVPALSIAGTKKWWPRKILEKYAMTHLSLSTGRIRDIFEQCMQAVTETTPLLAAYMEDHREFREIGSRMLAIWNDGTTAMATRGR